MYEICNDFTVIKSLIHLRMLIYFFIYPEHIKNVRAFLSLNGLPPW